MKRPATESMSLIDAVHWLLGDPTHRALVDATDLVDVLRAPRLKGLLVLDRDDLVVLEENRLDGKRMGLAMATGAVLGVYVGLEVEGEILPARKDGVEPVSEADRLRAERDEESAVSSRWHQAMCRAFGMKTMPADFDPEREVLRLRDVVAAAEAFVDAQRTLCDDDALLLDICVAVDAMRAARELATAKVALAVEPVSAADAFLARLVGDEDDDR